MMERIELTLKEDVLEVTGAYRRNPERYVLEEIELLISELGMWECKCRDDLGEMVEVIIADDTVRIDDMDSFWKDGQSPFEDCKPQDFGVHGHINGPFGWDPFLLMQAVEPNMPIKSDLNPNAKPFKPAAQKYSLDY